MNFIFFLLLSETTAKGNVAYITFPIVVYIIRIRADEIFHAIDLRPTFIQRNPFGIFFFWLKTLQQVSYIRDCFVCDVYMNLSSQVQQHIHIYRNNRTSSNTVYIYIYIRWIHMQMTFPSSVHLVGVACL